MSYFPTGDFGLEVARGMVPGVSPWTKVGHNPGIATSEEDVWSYGGAYSFYDGRGLLRIASSAALQDIGVVIKGDATGDTVQSDSGGSATTLVDADVDFTAATAVATGDLIILDPHGASPEWGIVESAAIHTLTVREFSRGGSGASRYYAVVDRSAKTGAQVVLIEGLASAADETATEIVVLNGTTAVNTVGTWWRVNGVRVIGAGSGGVPTGNITVDWNTSPVAAYITAGYTADRAAIYTVPHGKALYLCETLVSWATPNAANVQSARIILRSNREKATGYRAWNSVAGSIYYPEWEALVTNGALVAAHPAPIRFPALTDLKVSGVAMTGGSGPATVTLRGYLVDE